MNVMPNAGSFLFIVDTQNHAGSFERQLVAYLTGQVGECGVGSEEAKLAKEDGVPLWFKDHVLHLPDAERGYIRPASIWPTPGWFNDGMGGVYPDGTDPKAVEETYLKAIQDYADQMYPGKGQQSEAQREARTKFVSEHKTYGRWPAYLSVAVAFKTRPSRKTLDLLRHRAEIYCTRENITLTGVRLLEVVLTPRWEWKAP